MSQEIIIINYDNDELKFLLKYVFLLQVSSIEKRSIHVGRSVPTEINDPYVLEMAKTALTELDKSSNSLYKHKISRIIEAQKKVFVFISL